MGDRDCATPLPRAVDRSPVNMSTFPEAGQGLIDNVSPTLTQSNQVRVVDHQIGQSPRLGTRKREALDFKTTSFWIRKITHGNKKAKEYL